MTENFDSVKPLCYMGYYNNPALLNNSSSGGAASILAETVIKQGGAVYGVIYTDDFKNAEYGRALSIDELVLFKSTKYIASKKVVDLEGIKTPVYKLVEKDLKDGRTVLFTGLGCDIGAIKKYLQTREIDDKQLYTLDLICHGATFPEVGKQYVEMLEKRYGSHVTAFSVRYKKYGWVPHYLRAEFENGEVFEKPFYETEYGIALSKFSQRSCYNCKFKGEKHAADVTVGDFWGYTEKMHDYNPNGVSVLFVNTVKGMSLIEKIDKERFFIKEANADLAIRNNPMYWQSRKKYKTSDVFESILKKEGLFVALEKTSTIREKLRKFKIYKLAKRLLRT